MFLQDRQITSTTGAPCRVVTPVLTLYVSPAAKSTMTPPLRDKLTAG